MNNQPNWIAVEASASMYKWKDFLHAEAKRLFKKDGTHGSMMFSFNKEQGMISVNLIPPNIEHEQLNAAIINAVQEYNLYGVVFIGEVWMYRIKEKDHTAFQLLHGEMNVSDLHEKDKQEALMIRMENRDGDCSICVDEIVRDKNGNTLKEGKTFNNSKRNWFEV